MEVTDSSKKQILKSTGILGSAQVIIILIGIVRVKVLAVLLGSTGVGIAGLFQTTIDFVKSLTGFGLRSSAVRDIASSAATKDEIKIAQTVLVLRRWVWATGLLGMFITILFSQQLSTLAFGSNKYYLEISILSASLLISSISGGQSALLQGLRRISDVAKANVFSAFFGLIGAVFIYFFWGVEGIVPALLLIHILTLLVSWHYAKKIRISQVKISTYQVFQKGKSMASLGFFLSVTNIMAAGTMYLVRTLVMHHGGINSVGHFVAAWSISSMYISAIFGAMSADYFPRLSAVRDDATTVSRLVNEQTEVALLITAPIIIGMVSFIDIVVRIFYSKDFGPTADILDWQLIGSFFKVLSWPLGYVILAKGKGALFTSTELFWNALFCGSVYFGWQFISIEITGIAYLAAYIFYLLVILVVCMNMVSFRWSRKVWQYILIFLPLLIGSFLSSRFLNEWIHIGVCTILTGLSIGYSIIHLKQVMDINTVLKKLKLKK